MNMKDKEYSCSITVLTFCSAFTEFMASMPDRAVFPKERILGLMVLCFASYILSKLINTINFENGLLKIFSLVILSVRLVYIICGYIQYHRTFYGDGAVWLLVFTVLTAVVVYGKNKRIYTVYIWFLISNICIIFLLMLLSADLINAANIYSVNSLSVIYPDTMFVFSDVFTIALIIKDKKEKALVQHSFLLITLTVLVGITLLQGLCIKGDLLYSISPLQSLVQIFSGKTVKRYDYIFNILFTINYFGAVMLYIIGFNSLINKENGDEKI